MTKFARASAPEDRCWFCRECCGNRPVDQPESDHSRFAQWMPHLQRHVSISAHDLCFYENDEKVTDGVFCMHCGNDVNSWRHRKTCCDEQGETK